MATSVLTDDQKIAIAIDAHLDAPWIPNFKTFLIRPPTAERKKEHEDWYGDQITATVSQECQHHGAYDEMYRWYVPTLEFWRVHVRSLHGGCLECDVKRHVELLTGQEVFYAYSTWDKEIIQETQEDFQAEAMFFENKRRLWSDIGHIPRFQSPHY